MLIYIPFQVMMPSVCVKRHFDIVEQFESQTEVEYIKKVKTAVSVFRVLWSLVSRLIGTAHVQLPTEMRSKQDVSLRINFANDTNAIFFVKYGIHLLHFWNQDLVTDVLKCYSNN